MRILLAEDDDLLGAAIRAGLQQQGFQVDWVRDGQAALREALASDYEALVLDLGLPRLDGMEVLHALRDRRQTLPILVLTARDAVRSRIDGLDGGADDYVVKPVDLHELAARLRALVRRAHGLPHTVLRVGDLMLDPVAHQVTQQGQIIDLSQREFDLLHALMRNRGRVMSRTQLEQQIYPWGSEVASNAVEVHIYHLRRKCGSDLIDTVRGVGYLIPAEAA